MKHNNHHHHTYINDLTLICIASYTHCALGSCNSSLNLSFFLPQAAKVTAWQTKRSVDTIKNVVKEKIRLRNVVGGSYSRVKKTYFDKLSLSQKDEIRKVVIIKRFHNCLRKKYSEKSFILSVHYFCYAISCLQAHNEIQKCLNKEEGSCYPTTMSLHLEIMKIPGIPQWKFTTTYMVLRQLGFA